MNKIMLKKNEQLKQALLDIYQILENDQFLRLTIYQEKIINNILDLINKVLGGNENE